MDGVTKMNCTNLNYDNVSFQLAKLQHLSQIISFQNIYLEPTNPAVYNDEFACPGGIRAAVSNDRMVISQMGNEIIGIARFYERKRNQVISLYQFAISEKHRGFKLAEKMFDYLQSIRPYPIESCCPAEISLNDYYRKNEWTLTICYNGLNHWVRPLRALRD